MDDLREKVINGLECCASGNMCKEKCPYDELGYAWTECVRPLAEDALTVLKKLVPCSPIKSPNYNYSYYGYNCPKCGHTLRVGEYRPNYCEECGQAVKWE